MSHVDDPAGGGGEVGAGPDGAQVAGTKEAGFLRRLLDLVIAPGEAFTAIDRRPNTWWQPLLLLTLVSVAFVFFSYDRVIVPAQIEALRARGDVTGADLAQAEGMVRSSAMRALGVGGALIGTPVSALLVALVAHLVTAFLLGGTATFIHTWAVVCHALVVGVIEILVKLPAMLAQGTPEIPFGPALFLEQTSPPSFLYEFVKELDVFTFWKLGLLAVGLAKVHRLRAQTVGVSLVLVLLLWAVGSATVGTALRG